jgi:hypothetical protein
MKPRAQADKSDPLETKLKRQICKQLITLARVRVLIRNFQEHERLMRTHALVELGDSEAIDLFLREEDARAALEAAIPDEPDWAGLLRVERVDLDEREVSAD